jgi:sialate O-acetylesterase
VRISLGRIDDDDITWVNGMQVGRTQGYAERRLYTAPSSALRPGANVLVVRVADGGGGGGPYGDAAQFYVEIGSARRPLDATWRFRVGSVSIQPDAQRINKIPTVLYNRMLHPLQRYPIKGVIWYQGESNANNDEQARAYRPLFAELIRSWRRAWRGTAAEFPFLWVQLPNFGAIDTVPPARAAWATLRESQAAALQLPYTGQVVTIDVGDPADIHPRNKEPVGQRLARLARRVAYGEALLAAGPTYRGHTIRDRQVVIEFDNAGSGLESRSGSNVRGFAIAGADRRWVWADARIEGDRVIVSSTSVPQPVAVRYAWSNSPNAPGLYNGEGLPAAPFRTDDW